MSKYFEKISKDDNKSNLLPAVAVGAVGAAAGGAAYQHFGKDIAPEIGLHPGRKLVVYDARPKNAKKLKYRGLDVVQRAKNIPANSVVYNNSTIDLEPHLQKNKIKNVKIVNNPDPDVKKFFTHKMELHNDKHVIKEGLHIPTQTFDKYVEKELGVPANTLTKTQLQKFLKKKGDSVYIKYNVGSKSKGFSGSAKDAITGFNTREGFRLDSGNVTGEPVIDSLRKKPDWFVVQPKMDINKEYRIHVGPKGVMTSYERWGVRKPINAVKNLDPNFVASLEKVHKKITKGKDIIIGYDAANTSKGWKLVEANIMSDFLAGSHLRARNLDLKRFITGHGLKSRTVPVALAAGGASLLGTKLLMDKTSEEKSNSPLLPTLGGTAVAAGVGGTIYHKLRKPEYSDIYSIKTIQEDSGKKVTSIHYSPGAVPHKLLNKLVAGGSIKYVDYLDADKRTGYFSKSEHPVKGVLYAGQSRMASKWNRPDAGINMNPMNNDMYDTFEKAKFHRNKKFKDVNIPQWSAKEYIESKGHDPKKFINYSDNQIETLFKQWHSKEPIFVKSDSSNMRGLYGEMDKIRTHKLVDVQGSKQYVPHNEGYDLLRKDISAEIKGKPGERPLLFSKMYKGDEYRMHFLNGKFVNATPRWGDEAFKTWVTNKSDIDEKGIKKIEDTLSNTISDLRNKNKISENKAIHRRSHKFMGLDVLIDKKGTPRILEVNSSPMTLGMPMSQLRADEVKELKQVLRNKLGKDPNKLQVIKEYVKTQIGKNKSQYGEAKQFYKALTGVKEFRNVALAKAALPAAVAGVGTSYLLNKATNKNG